jgi:molybdenum cofactor guanylyltransferase
MLKSTGKFRINATGYILVGGASSRFGRDKALTEIAGKTMVARMAETLRELLLDSSLVGDPMKYGNLAKKCVPDLWPSEGPLGGILTALQRTASLSAMETSAYNLILSCDMPFLNALWLEELLSRAFASDAQVVVPQSSSGLEPLCSVWRTEALHDVQREFDAGVRKVTQAMKRLTIEVLDESVWKRFDKNGRLFWNMNTPADYEEARRILEDEEKWTLKFDQWATKFKGLD